MNERQRGRKLKMVFKKEVVQGKMDYELTE